MSNRKKRKANIFGSLFIGFLVVLAAQYVFFGPKSAIADTIIRFDEGYGSSANDSNQSVTSGTITNAVWKSEDLCRYGKCMYFDGTGDLVSFADNANLDITAKDTVTIHGWFRTPDITSGTRVLVAKHNATAGGYKIYMDSNGYLIFGIDDDSTWGPVDTASTSTTAFDDNKWHFFSAVKNGTTSISLYVDGVLFQTDSSLTETGSLANADTFYIGMDGNGSSNGYSGFLDEIRVLRTARTAAEIRTDFLGSSTTSGAPPVGHWKFDENTGTTNYDTTGYDNSLTMTNSPAWATGKYGYALDYNGTNSVSANFNVLSNLVIAGDLTIAAWIYRDTTTLDQVIVREDGDGAGEGGNENYRLYVNDTDSTLKIQWQYSASQTTQEAISTTALANPTGSWTHIAAVRNTTTNIVTFYENGKQLGNPVAFSNDPTGGGTTPDIYIGARDGSSGDPFDGKIDDVRIYNYTRSQTQILEDMQGYPPTGVAVSLGSKQDSLLSNGLVGYWKIDETSWGTPNCSATVVSDSSGNGSGLRACPNSTGPTGGNTGRFGSGTTFDGSDDYLENTSTIYNISGNLTVSAWVYITSAPVGDVYAVDRTNNNGGYSLGWNSSRFARLRIGNGTSTIQTTGTTALSLNTWHQITGTVDSTGLARIYVNGVLESTGATSILATTTGQNLRIGSRSAANTITGTLDEVRIYNRALTSDEVRNLYSFAPGPIAYYKFNENGGTTSVNDSSGYGHNGTMADFSSSPWTQGKYGSSLRFDSDDDWIDIYSSSLNTLFLGSQGTVSFWAKVENAGVWTNGQTEVIMKLGPDTSNTVTIQKDTGNLMTLNYIAGGTALDGSFAITPTDWFHMTMAWDKVGNTVKYYYNGVLLETDTGLGTWSGALSSTRTSLGNNYNGTSGWNGMIDEVKIYNYARNPSQIVQDMGTSLNSPVSYWKFDEGYGTTVSDATAQRNDLTLSAAGWSNSGKFGKAYDGATNRRLTRNDDSDFDFVNGSDDFSISLWFNRGGAISAQEYLIDKYTTNDGFTMYMDADGDIVCGIGDGTSFPEDTAGTTNANYDDTNWHHAVCVKSGTKSLTLYVDGRQVAQDTTIAADADMSNTGKLIIGDTNETDGTDEWLGDIDEVKIYRSALSLSEVQVEYGGGLASQLGDLGTNSSNVPNMSSGDSYCPPGQGSACTPPILHWKMDENSGSTSTYDSSSNGYTGTLIGSMTSSDWAPGKLGSALRFDGVDDSIQNTSISPPTGDFTYSIWIYPTAFATSNPFIGLAQATIGGVEFNVDTDTDGDIDVLLDNGAIVINGTNGLITLNRWHHITVTRIGSAVTSYINGKVDGTGTDADALSLAPCGIRVGRSQSSTTCSSGGSDKFQGYLDDFRVYNYGRTPEQVAWDYNRGAPMAWWKMDEVSWNNNCSTDTVFDSSGNAKYGDACPSSTGPVGGGTGKINNGGSFDGVNDYVQVASPALPTGDFSYTAWFYVDDLSNDRTILMASDGSAGSELLLSVVASVNPTNPNKIAFAADDSVFYTSQSISTGRWYHVAYTRASGTMRVYINGKLDSNTGSDSTTLNFSTCQLFIGLDVDTSGCAGVLSEFFDGLLDDVRVYNYALNATQVSQIMNDGAVKLGSSN